MSLQPTYFLSMSSLCMGIQQSNGDVGSFATPLPVKPRPTPIGQCTPSATSGDKFGSLRREFASTQSLLLGRTHCLVNSGLLKTNCISESSEIASDMLSSAAQSELMCGSALTACEFVNSV